MGHASEIQVGDRFYSNFYNVYVTAVSNAYRSPNGQCWDVEITVPGKGRVTPLRYGNAEKVRFN